VKIEFENSILSLRVGDLLGMIKNELKNGLMCVSSLIALK